MLTFLEFPVTYLCGVRSPFSEDLWEIISTEATESSPKSMILLNPSTVVEQNEP